MYVALLDRQSNIISTSISRHSQLLAIPVIELWLGGTGDNQELLSIERIFDVVNL